MMSEETGVSLGLHEQVARLNREMFDEGGKMETVKARVTLVEGDVKWQGKEIEDIKTTLKAIFDNTQWLKRALLTSIFGVSATILIGGVAAIVWSMVVNNK